MKNVEIFDTTLRDGEQGGIPFSPKQKMRLAQMSAAMGINTIEAGFPSSNNIEFDIVSRVAREVQGPYICGLSPTVIPAIRRTYHAVKHSEKPMIHVFMRNIDPLSVKVYNLDVKGQIEKAVNGVKFAKYLIGSRGRVEFSAQNLFLALDKSFEPEYGYVKDQIAELYSRIIEAGADVTNLPNTVAMKNTRPIPELFKEYLRLVPNADKAILSFHGHNDHGRVVSDSLEAMQMGIRQIEGTWGGIGERTGNAPLEEIIFNIEFSPQFNRKYVTDVDPEMVNIICREVEKTRVIDFARNKPVVGENAFGHGSGVHQDGHEKSMRMFGESIYWPCDPKEVGWTGTTHKINKLTGSTGVQARLAELGYDFNKDFVKAKIIGIIKGEDRIYEDIDLRVIGDEFRYDGNGNIEYLDHFVMKKMGADNYHAQVRMRLNGKEVISNFTPESAYWKENGPKGPINAVLSAIDSVIDMGDEKPRLIYFNERNLSNTHSSDGEVVIAVSDNGSDGDYRLDKRIWVGNGVGIDSIAAAAHAYSQAISRYNIDNRKI